MKWAIAIGLGVGLVAILIFRSRRQGQAPSDEAILSSLPPSVRVGQNPRTPQGGKSGTQALGEAAGIPGAKYIDRLDAKVGQPIHSTTNSVGDWVDRHTLAHVRSWLHL